MADVSLIEFIRTNKKMDANALYNDELLENSFLNKLINKLKLIKILIKSITKLFSTTAAHRDQVLKKIVMI